SSLGAVQHGAATGAQAAAAVPVPSVATTQRQPAAAAADPSRIWLPEIVERFAVSLTSNEVACALRLVNKAAAAQFSAPQHTTVRLSQPVPHHAFVRRWASPGAIRCLTRQQRLELPRLTARSGSIANLEVLLMRDDLPPFLDHPVFRAAAAAGQLDMCVWLRGWGCPFLEGDVLTAAAGAGQQAVCEWLLDNGCRNHWRATAAYSAAKGGHVGLMDWLLLRAGRANVGAVLRGAAEGCNLATLQRLHHTHMGTLPEGLPALYGQDIITAAAGSPTTDWRAKVEWLEARGYLQTTAACERAATKPDALPRLQWLRQCGYPLDMGVVACAAGAGNVEALQYVLGQGAKMHAEVMRYAAEGGHLAVMEMLHVRGVSVRGGAVVAAASSGHLPAVAWLVERLSAGAALTRRLFAAAARAGSMELLAWLRARGCPWDATAFVAATDAGSEEQLEWLAEQGCPMGDDGDAYACAAHYGDLAMLRCLRRLGCPWGPDGSKLTHAVGLLVTDPYDSRAHVQHVLSWLLDQGCPVDWYAVEAAIGDKGDEAMMGWLQAQPKQRAHVGSAAADPSRIWLPEIVQRFAVSLTSNEVACALRLVNKATAAQFSAPQHATIRLSQPVPHHAFVRRWASPDAMRTLTRQQRLELPCLTARSGSIANLEVLLARDDLPPVLNFGVQGCPAFEAAAAAGQLDVCVWLRQRGCPFQEGHALAAAARAGHQAVCEWLLANGGPGVQARWWAIAAAAEGGHVGLMDMLLLLRADSIDVAAMLQGAAGGCDLPTLQRLHQAHVDTLPGGLPALYGQEILSAAACSLTADWQAKVEWLEAQGYPQTTSTCFEAALKPAALPRLQWLRQRGYPLNSYVAASAAAAGNVEALQYVLGQGVEVNAHMMRGAAEGGHMAVMEVLHASGVLVREDAIRAAAAAGHLPAVAWLVERLGAGAALTTHMFAAAARAGSMELLGWMRARGCPWDAMVFAAAAAVGSEEQLEWLVEQGCPVGDDGEAYARAARHGDLAMLRCLRRLGCPWGPDGSTLTRAVEQ
ncbi:Ankyrin repeat domain-containing protein, partial [Tetrabaena socialis]